MEHSQAAEQKFVEKYLLQELSTTQRDEFEEHFFECPLCAADLRATHAFLEAARAELAKPVATPQSKPAAPRVPWWKDLLPRFPVLVPAALAASLALLIYQNVVTVPGLRRQVATLEQPEILPTLSLAGGASRGGSLASATVDGAHSILLQFDIPGQDRFTRYVCSLYSPAHQLLASVPVAAEAAKDTVSLRVPVRGKMGGGAYTLDVRGLSAAETAAQSTPVASYSFTISAGSNGAGL
jgi:hypothetical protein